MGLLQNTKFIILYGLCLLGNMFYGRSGLAVTVITNIIAIGIWNRKKWKQILLFFIVILFLFIFLLFYRQNFMKIYCHSLCFIVNI